MAKDCSSSADRTVRWLALGCGLFVWCFYLLRAAPTTYLLDSSELVNASWSLGISHPPGHPGFHILSYVAGLVPVGPFPWRIHLFAAGCTALGVGLLPLISHRIRPLDTALSRSLAVLFSLMTGLTTALILQSIRGEVYSLQFLVASVILWLLASRDKLGARSLTLTAVALGIGLLNHHYLTFFLFPAVLVWLALARLGSAVVRTAVAWSSATGAALLLGYGALLARGAARPHGSWAWPDSLQSLYWVVSAQAFQKTAAKVATVDPATGCAKLALLFMEQVGPLALLLAFGGLLVLALQHARIGVPLVVLLVCNLATQFIFNFDPWNPDVLGYFMASFAVVALSLTWVFQQLCDAKHRSNIVRLTGYGLLPLTIAFWGVAASADGRTRDLSHYRESEIFRDAILRTAPAETLWVTAYFETAFQTWYAQGPEDQRPDLIHLHRSFRTYKHYDAMVLAREPRLSSVLKADASRGGLSVAALSTWDARAAVRVEPDELVSDEELAHLTAGTAALDWTDMRPTSEERERSARTGLSRWRLRFPPGSAFELQTSRNLIWWSVGYARFLQRTGRPESAAAFLGLALEQSPNDPDLLALQRQLQTPARADD